LTAFIFLFNVSAFARPIHAPLKAPVSSGDFPGFPRDLNQITLPPEIGKIEEIYQARGQVTGGKAQANLLVSRPVPPAPLVVLIQDAHAIPEAQRNIQTIIEHFQTHYDIDRVAVEGAASELDLQIFKSFPDQELLKKTFEDYFDNGELTGPTAAAILNDSKSKFLGVEDWKLYEEGLGFYLAAMDKELELLEKLQDAGRRLQAAKEKIYSRELLELDKALDAFRRNEADLVTILKKLDRIQIRGQVGVGSSQPVPLSIQTLFEELENEGKDQSAIEKEVREIAEELKKHLLQAAGRKPQDYEDSAAWSLKLAAFNQKFQDFQTSRITPAAFALFLKEFLESGYWTRFVEKGTGNTSLPVPFSAEKTYTRLTTHDSRLTQLIRNHKHLRDIEGTQFFQDFERYAQSVKESLFRSEEEKKLDRESRSLYLFEKLANLELSREEWREFKEWLNDYASSADPASGRPDKKFPNRQTAKLYKSTKTVSDQAFFSFPFGASDGTKIVATTNNSISIEPSTILNPNDTLGAKKTYIKPAPVSISQIRNNDFEMASRRAEPNMAGIIEEPASAVNANNQLIYNLNLYFNHFAFYENAEKRDKAFFVNLKKLMDRQEKSPVTHGAQGSNSAILIAGGFHTRGLAKQFRENGISYAIVQPQITQLSSSTHSSIYRSQMRGEVSWKNYFEVKNGKIDLYKAFVRGVRDRLLRGQETRDRGQDLSLPLSPVSFPLLKNWRDQILRDLVKQEKISKASEYIRFIDEIAQQENKSGFAGTRLQRIDKFIEGLRQLKASRQLNEGNILKLLKPATMVSAYLVPAKGNLLSVKASFSQPQGYSGMRRTGKLNNSQLITPNSLLASNRSDVHPAPFEPGTPRRSRLTNARSEVRNEKLFHDVEIRLREWTQQVRPVSPEVYRWGQRDDGIQHAVFHLGGDRIEKSLMVSLSVIPDPDGILMRLWVNGRQVWSADHSLRGIQSAADAGEDISNYLETQRLRLFLELQTQTAPKRLDYAAVAGLIDASVPPRSEVRTRGGVMEVPRQDVWMVKENGNGQIKSIAPGMEVASQKILKEFIARYGILDAGDPVAAYVQRIAARLAGGKKVAKYWPKLPQVYVLREHREEIGFALPDGSIVLSLPMLDVVKSEDELAFLLAHEMVHIQQGHSEETLRKARGGKMTAVDFLGNPRLHEYAADLTPVVSMLSEVGYHPLGGSTFFESLKERFEDKIEDSKEQPTGRQDKRLEEAEEKQEAEAWSTVHGGLEDRRLNILSLRYLLDLEGIRKKHTPLDPQWKEALKGKIEQMPEKPAFEVQKEKLLEANARQAEQVIEQIFDQKDARGWLLLREVLPQMYQEVVNEVVGQIYQIRKGKKTEITEQIPLKERNLSGLDPFGGSHTKLVKPLSKEAARMHESATRVYSELLDKFVKSQEEKGLSLSDEQRDAWLMAVMLFGLGVNLFEADKLGTLHWLLAAYKVDNYGEKPFYAGMKITDSLLEKPSLDSFISFLKPETFRELGIEILPEKVEEQVENFMNYLASESVGIWEWQEDPSEKIAKFFAEADRLIEAVDKLYQAYGYENLDKEKLSQARLRIVSKFAPVKELVEFLRSKDFTDRVLALTLGPMYGLTEKGEEFSQLLGLLEDFAKATSPDQSATALFASFLDERELWPEKEREDLERLLLNQFKAFIKQYGVQELFHQVDFTARSLSVNAGESFLLGFLYNLEQVGLGPAIEEANEDEYEFIGAFLAMLSKERLSVASHKKIIESLFSMLADNVLTSTDSLKRTKDTLRADAVHLEPFLELIKKAISTRPDFTARDLSPHIQDLTTRVILRKLFDLIGENKLEEAWQLLERAHALSLIHVQILDHDKHVRDYILNQVNPAELNRNVRMMIQQVIKALYPQVRENPGKLLLLTDLFTDFEIQRRVRDYAVSELLKGMDYQEAVEFIFGKDGTRPQGTVTVNAFRVLMQKIAGSPPELQDLEERLLKLYRESSERIGQGVLIDAFLKYAFQNSWPFLTAALQSRKSDKALASLAFEEWWSRFYNSQVSGAALSPISLEYIQNKRGLSDWVKESPGQLINREFDKGGREAQALMEYTTVREMLGRLYQTDHFQRGTILRKVLMDLDNGVFRDKGKGKELILQFVRDHVVVEEKHLAEIEKVARAFVQAASPDQLYFLLSPVLSDAILQRPENVTEPREIVHERLNKEFNAFGTKPKALLEKKFKSPMPLNGVTLNSRKDVWGEKVKRWSFGVEGEKDESAIASERVVFNDLPKEYKNPPEFHQLSPSGALKHVAQYIGAPAIRGLQVLGQYIEIPPEAEEDFEDLYDQNEGQSKIVFNRTVRERSPGFLKDQDRITEKLGAGSLVTVYLIKREDGKKFVLKVLNPNAEDRVIEIMDLAVKVLDNLLSVEPENKVYQMIRYHLLPDLRTWLLGDIRDKRFFENDKKFRAKFQGWANGTGFSIFIPEALNFENIYQDIYLKAEEYVEGHNINRLKIGDKDNFKEGIVTAESYKKIGETLEKFFWAQVQDPLGLAHADGHKGNFRLMPDGRIAILDRNFYIELSEEDRGFIQDFRKAKLSDWFWHLVDQTGVAKKKLHQLLSYLLSFEENKEWTEKRPQLEAKIFAEWEKDESFKSGDPVASLKGLVLVLKKNDIFLPLKFTLLLRNIHFLHKLSQKVPKSQVRSDARSEVRSARPGLSTAQDVRPSAAHSELRAEIDDYLGDLTKTICTRKPYSSLR